MATEMMANEKFIQENSRCIYENEDILVEHSFMSYPDNTREAVMLVALKKDGKFSRWKQVLYPFLETLNQGRFLPQVYPNTSIKTRQNCQTVEF